MSFRALIRKDLKVFASDRRAMIVSFAVPAVLATFMGFIFKGGGGGSATPRVSMLVVDQDHSPAAQVIIKGLSEDPIVRARPATEAGARSAVLKGDVDVAVVIPPRFAEQAQAAFAGGQARPDLPLLYDPTHRIELAVAESVVARHVEAALGGSDPALLERCAAVAKPYQPREEVVAAVKVDDLPNGISSSTRPQKEEYNGGAHTIAGMGVQFILFGAIESAVGILTDRQRGLWKRLQAAPLSRGVLLASKIVSGALIALAVLAFLFVVGHLTLGVSIQGSLPGFALVAASFAVMASTVGVLISTLGKTPQTTRSFSIFAMLVLVMLSGAWFPTFLFPAWLRSATLAIPTRWAVDGLDAMTWRGLGFDAALLPAAVLLGSALLFGALAVARFRWEE